MLFKALPLTLNLLMAVIMLSSPAVPNSIVNLLWNALLTLHPFLMLKYDENHVFHAWIGTQTFPTLIYLFTESPFHCFIQSVIQLFYLKTIYIHQLQSSLIDMSSSNFVDRLSYSTTLGIIVITILLGMIHYSLKNAYDRLSEAEKKKTESERQRLFLLGFSHELRNLIGSLIGNIKLSRLENLTEKLNDLLLNAELCGELLLHLVNNILDSGKLEVGDLEINPTPTNLYNMIERAWGVCSEIIKNKGLKGRLRVQRDMPRKIMIDHYRLLQILLNLVGNAVKFTERGDVDISVEWIAHTPYVTEKCFRPYPLNDDEQDEGAFEKSQSFAVFEGNVCILDLKQLKISRKNLSQPRSDDNGVLKITVSDTGYGIEKADLTKIFRKFHQGSHEVGMRRLGTGLGLFITEQLCQRMNGSVRAFSKLGKGSSFIVCIATSPCNNAQNNLQQEEEENNLNNSFEVNRLRNVDHHVLVVDDDHFNNMVVSKFFQKLGVEAVGTARNGLEAYNKYLEAIEEKSPYTIITMDIEMPKMNGKTAAQKIRQFEKKNGLKPCYILMISANCLESEINECIDKNGTIMANAFLKKPISPEELQRAVDSSSS